MVAIRYGWFVAVCKLLNFEGPTLCSTAVLTANKYTPNVNHVKVVGENATTTPLQTPAYDSLNTNRSAIALDCENVGVGEILIDTLVQPLQSVTDWRTKYSGISESTMTAAVIQRRIVQGWPEARDSLFNHIDANTIIVGQGLNHDLICLSIKHQ